MMTRTFTLLTLVAGAALAGCNNETIVSDPAGPDPQANAVANAASVTLPPSIQATKAYRCKDNSLVYIDWMSDGTARAKKGRNEVGTPVPIGEGQPLQGDPNAGSIIYQGQSCKA